MLTTTLTETFFILHFFQNSTAMIKFCVACAETKPRVFTTESTVAKDAR